MDDDLKPGWRLMPYRATKDAEVRMVPFKKVAECVFCSIGGEMHIGHYFEDCTCAAAGCGTDHSGHCNLGRAQFFFDDAKLRG